MINASKLFDIFTTTIIKAGSVIVVLGVSWIVAPVIETEYFPVVRDVKAVEVISSNPKSVALLITGVKSRRCEFKSMEGISGTTKEPSQSEIKHANPLDAKATEIELRSRPTGYQSFGVFEVEPGFDYVKIKTTHDCGMPWGITTSVFVEWRRVNPR